MAVYTVTSTVTELLAAGMTAAEIQDQAHGVTIMADGSAIASGQKALGKLDALLVTARTAKAAAAAKAEKPAGQRANRYAGTCWKCRRHVEAGAGMLVAGESGWLVQHADCYAVRNADGTGWSRYSRRIQTTCNNCGGHLVGTRCADCSTYVDENI